MLYRTGTHDHLTCRSYCGTTQHTSSVATHANINETVAQLQLLCGDKMRNTSSLNCLVVVPYLTRVPSHIHTAYWYILKTGSKTTQLCPTET